MHSHLKIDLLLVTICSVIYTDICVCVCLSVCVVLLFLLTSVKQHNMRENGEFCRGGSLLKSLESSVNKKKTFKLPGEQILYSWYDPFSKGAFNKGKPTGCQRSCPPCKNFGTVYQVKPYPLKL